MNKLHHKDFSIAFKTGTDANKSKFKKEAVQGEMYFATDSKNLYVAETTAGAIDATLSQFESTPFNQYSVSFDGSNDYATSTLGSQVFDGDFSLSFWFNTSVSPQYQTLLQLGDASAYTDGFRLYRNYTTLQFWDGVGGYDKVLEGGAVSNGSWHNVAITRSGTSCSLYVNGSSVDTGTSSQVFTSTAFKMSFSILPFNGLLDEVALWDSALSPSDISTLRGGASAGTLGLPADISSLNPINWWRMGDNDGGTGTTITDQGSGGNNGTLTNGPTFSTNVPS